MLQLLIAILSIILTILIVIGFHELGHFWVARLFGVKVLRFSIGFGKILWSKKDRKGTEYVIAAIPLGGYVKLLDEGEGPVAKEDLTKAYNTQLFYKKFAIVAAGPIFNLILAFLIYWALYVIGFNSMIPVIGGTTPNSIAANAGLKAQQEIIAIDETPVTNWVAVIIHLLPHAGNKDQIYLSTKDLNTQKIEKHTLDIRNWYMNDLKPDPLTTLGIIPFTPLIPPVVGKILPDSPSAQSLKLNDKILRVHHMPIKDWGDLLEMIDKNPDTTLLFEIQRAGKTLTLPVFIGHERDQNLKKHGFLGISAQFKLPEHLIKKNKYDPMTALSYAWQETKDFCRLNFIIFGKLFTGKISLESLGGPITIYQSAGNALNNGILPFFSFLAFLSISIGLVNVLPIPGLDGGLCLFLIIESLMGRPIPVRVQSLFYRLGLILLFLLVSQSLINDIARL